MGVPIAFGRQYFEIPQELSAEVDGKPTGRYCFDCVPAGLSKSLVVDYLTSETAEVAFGRALAFGDQPLGNDEGLTRWHAHGLPFVSVSETSEMVPSHLADCHVRKFSNAEAAAAVLGSLADIFDERAEIEPQEKLSSFSEFSITDLVQKINQ